MFKNYRSLFVFLALVLLIIGMGCTTENQVAKATSLAVETAQTEDEADSGDAEDNDCVCEDYEEIETPLELIPAYLPEGYELVEAYLFEVEESDEDAIWYAPGKGTATGVEFFGPGDEDFIEVITSASPYDSLEAWISEVSAIEFEEEDFDETYSFEEDVVTIKNTNVLLED